MCKYFLNEDNNNFINIVKKVPNIIWICMMNCNKSLTLTWFIFGIIVNISLRVKWPHIPYMAIFLKKQCFPPFMNILHTSIIIYWGFNVIKSFNENWIKNQIKSHAVTIFEVTPWCFLSLFVFQVLFWFIFHLFIR